MNYLMGIVNKVWPKKIRSQLILGIVIVHLLLMAIFVYDMTNRQKNFLKEQHLEQTKSMVGEYVLSSKNYIIVHDLDGLERLTLAQNNFPHLKYAMILSPDKEVLTHTDKNYIGSQPNDNISLGLKNIPLTQILLDNNSIIDIASPVLQDNKIIGWARVGIDQEYIHENLLGIVRNGILYMLIALVVGFLVAISVGNRLNKGLYSLIHTTDKIREGDRSLRVSPFKSFEISKLGTAINQMLDEISANERLLEMVLENLSVGVFVLGETGEIRSANTASKEIWKDVRYVGPEEYGEYKAWFTETKEPVKHNEWGAAITLATGNPVLNQEVEIECFDGSRKTILNSAIPLKDNKEKIIGAIAINVDITERKKAEAVILKANHDIGERVKELTCLYFLTKLANDPEKLMADILQECVNSIPPSYQYPEITTARIIFGDQVFESTDFSVSVWKQDAFIRSNDNKIGLIEVFYTSQMPDEQEGPFLKEERFLINSIADIIGSTAERRKAESAIKEQAETFQAIIENTKESIYLISPDYGIIQFNKTAKERIRLVRNIELYIGIDFRKILFPETKDRFCGMFEDALKGISRTEEIRAELSNGEYFWLQAKMSPVFDLREKLIGVTLLTEGISDRKNAEKELRESEEKFRSLVEQSLVGVYIIQGDMLTYVNPGFEKIFGYRKEQMIDKMSFEDFVHEDDLEKIKKNYTSRIDGTSPASQYVFRGIKSDGSVLHLEVIVSTIIYNGNAAMIGTLIDITDRMEEEKRIGKAVNEAQENERIQIGMELHDNVSQILVASLISVGFIKGNLAKTEVAIEQLDKLKNYTNDAIDELRRLSHQLAPSINTEDTLKEKIVKLTDTMSKGKKLNVLLEVEEPEDPLHNDIQTAFYRILQEQLKNILKYAKASSVLIRITLSDKNIVLRIKDDGQGFDTTMKKAGIGLENIKRRSHILGGEAKIISSPGNGCEVSIEIPL